MPDVESEPPDIALVLGASDDGQRVGVLRQRGDEAQLAVLEKAEEGRPLHGDLVRLRAREEPHLYDVETVFAAPRAAPRATSGPAQVASSRYRSNWGRVFARRPALPS